MAVVVALACVLTLGSCTPANTSGASSANASGASSGGGTSAASGSSSADEADLTGIIPDKTLTLTVYSQLANYSGEQLGWAAALLKDKFNVQWNIVNDAIDGTFSTRMASGNLGDIVIFGDDTDQYQQAIQAGMLYNWEGDDNLVQTYAPYIYAHMQSALEQNRTISGGTVYGFGYDVAADATNHSAYSYYPDLRWDLYQKLGDPQIKTLEDFIPVLQQMQQLEPQTQDGAKTYGVSLFPDWDGNMVMEVKATAALYGYDEFELGLYNVNTQTYEDCLKDGGMYLRCLKFYNTLYQDGLLDPDSMTQDYNTMLAKYQNGQAFFNIFQWIGDAFNTDANTAAGERMMAVAAEDQKNIVYGLNVLGGNRVWTIGAQTNYPELCMAIINWLSTPEGVLDYNYGPEGVTWDYNAAGDTELTSVGVAAQLDPKDTQITFDGATGSYQDGQFQHNNTTWSMDATNPDSASGETFDYKFWQSYNDTRTISPVEKSWQDFTGYPDADAYLEGNNYYSLSIGSGFAAATQDDALKTTWTQVTDCIKTGSWNAIYAKTDADYNTIVAKMISDAKAYGYDQCVTWSQQQADLRKAAEDAVTSSQQ